MFKKNKKYLDELNIPQKQAVTNTEGTHLVLAGAGSGKTRVLIYRLMHLLIENKAHPSEILAVTFTNKAASEMKSRINKIISTPIESMWIGTFHSLCVKILRNHSKFVGLKSNFIIIDSEDQKKLINQICESEKIDLKEKNYKYFYNIIDGFKNNYITLSNIKNFTKKIDKDILKIYERYEKELLRLNCVDFGNLLIHTLTIFNQNKNILEKYQKQFKYILVDEYQDINFTQQLWLRSLYEFNKNIFCVGDDDQSIYSWRGADVSNILNFEKTFNKPNIIKLEQNYRSTQNILDGASGLISINDGRYGKKLWSDKGKGEKIKIQGFWEIKEEANFISNEIENLISKKVPYSQIAILLRVSAHTRSFEERFINIGLPYKIVGGIRFYERREIKDIISYFRLINNSNDDLAFERIINIPKRGVGKVTLKKISNEARTNNISKFEATKNILDNFSSNLKIELNEFIKKIIQWKKIKNEIYLEELAQIILEDSKYLNLLEQEAKMSLNPENLSRLDNIKELIESLKNFKNLEGFLEHVGLVIENINNSSDEKINIMTMHSSKGLEFDYVFLSGWEEEVFPSKRTVEELGKTGLEEERRLAYVALTRARKKIQITYVNQNRYSYMSHDQTFPSRFINELPKQVIDYKNSSNFHENDFVSEFSNSYDKFQEIITPGRQRILDKSNIDEIEWEFNQDYSENDFDFIEGKKVYHNKFGYGKIIESEGEKVSVLFNKNLIKKIFIKYLKIIN